MKTISTGEFGSDLMQFGQETDRLELFPGRITPVSSDVLILDYSHRSQLQAFARGALLAYGPKYGLPEPTKVQVDYGVTALVTRVDCTIEEGQIKPFELEDRPAGLGIAHLLQVRHDGRGLANAIREHFSMYIGDTPFVIVSGKRPYGTDDPLVFGEDKYHYEKNSTDVPKKVNGGSVLLRTVTGDSLSSAPYVDLVPAAVAPVVTEGDKTYLERLGLVRPALSAADLMVSDDGELVSQVLKPNSGSMSVDVSIFLDKQRKVQHGDHQIVTEAKFKNKLAGLVLRDGFAYIQKFAPPIRIENPEGRKNMILRMIVLSHPIAGTVETEVIGGCYVARRENIVHGSENAVSGSVLVQ